jgi:hypothetical protein
MAASRSALSPHRRATLRSEIAPAVGRREPEQPDTVADLLQQAVGGARPQPDRPVVTRRRQRLPIRAPGHAEHLRFMAFESAQRLPASWPSRVRSGCPPIRAPGHAGPPPTAGSSLADASVFPSGLQATLFTEDSWPSRVRSGCPPAASHSRIVPSSLADASVFPSGLQLTSFTPSA